MALSDRNIVITPNKGKSADPSIAFSGANATVGAQTIYANVYPFSGGTISFEASSGQLFSISNNLSGTIFSVNDVSGIPSISVDSSGLVLIAPYGGKVGLGTASSTGLGSNVFAVYGSAHVTGNVLIKSTAAGGAGIYFPDGTFQTTLSVNRPSFGSAGTIQYAGAGNTFAGNSGSLVWDTANNRLGVGTSAPNTVFNVNGTTIPLFQTSNAMIGGNNFEIMVGNSTVHGVTLGYVNNTTVPYGYLSAGTSTRNIIIGANGRVGIGGAAVPQTLLDVGGGAVFGATWAGNTNFINPPTNGLSVQGSVGVGTYTPLSVLDVNGNASFRSAISVAGTATVSSLVSNVAVSIGGAAIGSNELSLTGGALGTVLNNTVPLMSLYTTTSNADYLEFFNIRNASGGTDWTTAGNRIQERVDATYMGWIGFNNGNTTVTNNGGISFGTGTSTLGPNGVGEKMRLDPNGRLGIATTAPGSILDVNGNASFRSAVSIASGLQSATVASNGAVSGTTGTFTGALYGSAFNTAGAATVASLVSNGTITASTFANGATTVNMFTTDTATNTFNIATAATISGSTKTINLGTGGAAGSTTNINLGDADGGTTTVNSPSLVIPGNMSIGANILATTGPILTLSALIGGGTGYMNGTHTNQALTGSTTGAYMLATVTVALGVVTGITLTWGGQRYSAGDVLTVPSLTTTLATTATSGDGVTATITFAAQAAAPFQVGAQIIVAGITPTGYNGTFTVTACTTTTVSYANATTGAQTVAGTVKMGAALTNSTISAATIQGTDVYVSSAISTSIGARLRLEYNSTAVAAGYEYGAIAFASRDLTAQASGDLALIRGVAAGTSGGSEIQFWTAANGAAPLLSAVVTSAGDFRMYNASGTFYTELANAPAANRTITIPDVGGTMSIIQAAATNGYFDTSAVTPTGTARLNYNGYFYPTFINLVGSGDTATAATHYFVETGTDGFVRPKTLANAQAEIVTTATVNAAAATTVGTITSGVWNAGAITTSGNLSFGLANPTISSSSYVTISGGLYVSGGTLYSQVVIQARGGISNDSATTLSITGGTSNITNVTGALNATGEITAYSSDLRLKDDIRLISDPISKVLKLRGVTFEWKQSAVDHKVVQQRSSDVGVIAQEVQAVLPEAVRIAPFDKDDDGGSKSGENYLTVQYEKLTALLIEAVKEQQGMIDDLKARISALEAKN